MSDREQERRPIREGARKRRPLFDHLEENEGAARARIGPPAPLRDLVGDLDDELPVRAAPPRPKSSRTPAPPSTLKSSSQAPKSPPVEQPGRAKAPARPTAAPKAVTTTTHPRPSPRPLVAPVGEDEEFDHLRARQEELEHAETKVHFLEQMSARPYSPYIRRSQPILISLQNPMVQAMIAICSLLIIFTLGRDSVAVLSSWGAGFAGGEAADQSFSQVVQRSPGDYNLQGAPSINAQQIDRILASYGSPASGTGQIWYELGRQYGIDPAFAIAFFIMESSAGTAPGWAGFKPDGTTTHNVGNIICAGYRRCHNRFRDYNSWEEGIADWYRLIDVEYIKGRGTYTLQEVIPIYAPSFENDVDGYINTVARLIDGWRINGVP